MGEGIMSITTSTRRYTPQEQMLFDAAYAMGKNDGVEEAVEKCKSIMRGGGSEHDELFNDGVKETICCIYGHSWDEWGGEYGLKRNKEIRWCRVCQECQERDISLKASLLQNKEDNH